jgi:hypothetical protein
MSAQAGKSLFAATNGVKRAADNKNKWGRNASGYAVTSIKSMQIAHKKSFKIKYL